MNLATKRQITAATNLRELAALVNAGVEDNVDLSSLPTFGGDAPADTTGIWSWDANSLLYGEALPFGIISRAAYAELIAG